MRTALRPMRPRDTLLARYLRRWPKTEPPYEALSWARAEAEAAEREAGLEAD